MYPEWSGCELEQNLSNDKPVVQYFYLNFDIQTNSNTTLKQREYAS